MSAGLILFFESDDAPDLATLVAAATGVARLAIVDHPSELADGSWSAPAGLCIDGLTFDVALFADVPGAMTIRPGPHIAAGAHLLPVVRGWLELAVMVGQWSSPAARAVAWQPAGHTCAFAAFAEATARWLGGGAFPAEVLIRFDALTGGGVRTCGLAHFTGQELELAPAAANHGDAVRLAARIAEHLVLRGHLSEPEQLAGPDGASLMLVPGADGALVLVRPG